MKIRVLISWSLLVAGIPLSAGPASAQSISRAETARILAEAVTHVLGRNPEGKYERPVLVSARIDPDLARTAGIDSVGLTASVSRVTQVPIWDGEKYCDATGRVPHWRMSNADFRLSPTLTRMHGDTAHVSVAFSGSPSMAGITVRTLRLVRSGADWTATGFTGAITHASSSPCSKPPDPVHWLARSSDYALTTSGLNE